MTHHDGGQDSFAPDSLGRATQVHGTHLYAGGERYHPDGSMASYTLGNGIRFSTTQNTRLLPSNYTYSGPHGTTLDENYTYDANGNLVTLADVVNGANNQTLSYDGLNRLINAQAPHAWGSRIYAYDALNNLRQANSNGYPINYNPDALNRMGTTTFGTTPFASYIYDDRGNRISETGQGATTTFTFDAKNQLLQIPGIVSYSYDAFGRRVQKVPASGTATGFLYGHGGQLLMAYDEAAPLNTNYIYLNGKVIARHQGGTVTYTLTDRQGTPVREASGAGVVGVSFSYDPYGTLSSGPYQQQPGYTGHVYDPETEFSYMQARYQDGPVGRMLSADPVYPSPGDLFAFNRYAYADNNPIMRTDPDGRDTVGENIDENAQAAANRGDNVATFGWAFAGAAWDLLGAEAVSQVADKRTSAGSGNMAMAAISIVTLGKGEEAVTVAKDVEQGVANVAKGIEKAAADSQGPRFATGKLRQQVMDKGRQADGTVQCKYCGKATATQSNHVVPYSKDGTTKVDLEPSCSSCNASKGSKDLGTQWIPPKQRTEQ